MTSTSANFHDKPLSNPNGIENNTNLILRILIIWHVIFPIGALTGGVMIWQNASSSTTWLKILSSSALGISAIFSLVAAYSIRHKNHRGRLISLIINYLGFLVCFFSGLHYVGVFTGIDALGAMFGRGLPYLGIAFIGYLIGAFGDRYADKQPATAKGFKQISKYVSLIGGVLFLLAVGIIPGTIALLSRLKELIAIIFLVGTVTFGLMTWLMWREPSRIAMNAKSKDQLMLDGYLFLSPNFIGFLFFFAGPLLFSLYISFTDSDAFGNADWVGLANYQEIFNITIAPLESADQLAKEVIDISIFDELTRFKLFSKNYVIGAEDQLFWISLGNTIKFVLLAVPLSVIPALALATVLNSKLPGMKLFRAIYFIPSVAAVVGVAMIWRWLYNSTVGYLNFFISSFIEFVNSIVGSQILTDPQIGWTSDTKVALLAVAIMAAWQWMGFNTVLFLAGLQNIPGVLYEAATVDGANNWQQFWNVTLPTLAPTTFFVLTTTTINAMQIFDQVFVFTRPPGGPGTSTTTIVLYLYRQGFQNFRQGYASALAWVLFLLIFGLTLFQYMRQRSGDEAI
jgi:ABC-type sugar transport system permease subunit